MARKQVQEDSLTLGLELLGHLRSTGTPEGKLSKLSLYVGANPNADKDELYKFLEDEHTNLGTLTKAGKYLFGDHFEPQQLKGHVPEEDLNRLRLENANLKEQLATATRNLATQKRRLEAEIEDLRHQLVQKDRTLELESVE